jgi:hypothetical protein
LSGFVFSQRHSAVIYFKGKQMVKSRLLEVGVSKLKVLTAAALVAAGSLGAELSFAEGPEGLVFTSRKNCEEAAPGYTKTLDSGKLSSFCLANDPARSYSYPEVQEEWQYKCRQTSATTWALLRQSLFENGVCSG